MPTIQFGDWQPDQPDFSNRGVLAATNALPGAIGYLPAKQLVVSTDALTARPQGAIQARDTSGTVYQYAGDATKLYRNASNTWTDASRTVGGAYTTGSDEHWSFAVWENKVIATNFADDPQEISMGSANFVAHTTAFKARYVAVVGDFVVFANVDSTPSRLRWSGIGDETTYVVSATTQSDFRDLRTEAIKQIFGGEYGVIFQGNAVWRMTYVGSPVVFQFDNVLPGIGLIAPGAAARAGDEIFFLSDQGFFSLTNGSQARPIGVGKVDRFVLDSIDKSNLNRISAVTDASSQRIFWTYPGEGSVNGRPNKIVVYDRGLQRWACIEEDVELLWRAGGTGTTLDGLDSINSDLDALGISLDSSRWVGGAEAIGVFDEAFKSGFFDGDNKTATIETGDISFIDGARAKLNGFRPLVEGSGTISAQIGEKNSPSSEVSFGSSLTPRTEGRITTRSNARYHRFRLTLSGAWEHAIGVQIDPTDIKQAGRRG